MTKASVPASQPFAALARAAQAANNPPLAARAEDDDEDAKAKKAKEDEDKAKKAKEDKKDKDAKAEGDDDSDEDDKKDKDAKAARRRERGRIQAILTSEAGLANYQAAAHFAFNTNMTRNEAIGALMTSPKPAASADPLRSRMADQPNPDLGNSEVPAANLAQQIIMAGKKARGEKI